MKNISRLFRCLKVLVRYRCYSEGASYYPNVEHKTKTQILRDQLTLAWRYGATEPYYFLYGFDRKEMTLERMTDEYLTPFSSIQKRIAQLNTINPKYGKFCARVVTADKYYFNIFLKHFGFSTPQVYLYIKDKELMYVSSRFSIDRSVSVENQLRDFFSNDMDAFVKPSGGQLGMGAFKLDVKDGIVYVDKEETPVDVLIKRIMQDDYLVQECIYQHPKMNEINPSCINSIRLQTVIDEQGVVHPFAAGLRIGHEGTPVDNWAKGGVFVGIDMNTGKLMETGFFKPEYGTTIKEHMETHVVFRDFEIPYFKDAVNMAVNIHQRLYRCHSVGWDIAITENGPMFIEGNGLWEISLLQAVHGGLKKSVGVYFDQLRYKNAKSRIREKKIKEAI